MALTSLLTHLVGAHLLTKVGGGLTKPAEEWAAQQVRCAMPVTIPEPGDLLEAYVRGYMAERQVKEYMCLWGIPWQKDRLANYNSAHTWQKATANTWGRITESKQGLPTIEQGLTMLNREIINPILMDHLLIQHGIMDQEYRDALINLRFEIPGPSDLVRFAVRHVFEPDIVRRFGFNEEINPDFLLWHERQGFGYPFTIKHPRFGEWKNATWAQAHWWAHWVWPSPTQGYLMFQQLRKGRHAQRFPEADEHPVFEFEDLLLMLRGNDYPVGFRKNLAAISYRVPGFRQVRQLRQQEVIDEKEHVAMYQDMGYSARDSNNLQRSDFRVISSAKRRAVEQQARSAFAKGYDLGAFDSGAFFQLLTRHGLTDQEARDTLELAAVDQRIDKFKFVVGQVRSQVLRGIIDLPTARQKLTTLGMAAERREEYLSRWGLILESGRRTISAGKIVKWACDGFITLGQAGQRLRNLGYPDSDITGFLAEIGTCVSLRVARAAAEEARARQQTLRQQQRAIRELRQALRQSQSDLSRHGSPAQLAKWFWKCLIPRDQVFKRLEAMGWPDADIIRHIDSSRPKEVGSCFPTQPPGR